MKSPSLICILALAHVSLLTADTPTPPASTNWPITLSLPGEVTKNNKPSILAWVPPGAQRIRAVLVTVENTDSILFAEHAPLREVARKYEMAIVHACHAPHAKINNPDNPSALPLIMNAVAEKTGVVEFRNAPWITFGKSSQGAFPFQTAWKYPKRTIASIGFHAETPSWPLPDWVKLDKETILHVNANGAAEWGGTWYSLVRPTLLNYRANTAWLTHQTVARNVAHGDYPGSRLGRIVGTSIPGKVGTLDTFNYLTVFVAKALSLRLPEGKYPTDGPVTLNQVDEEKGYLIDQFAIEDLFQQQRMPLIRTPQGYSGTTPTTGFIEIAPAKDFVPAEGVPVTPLTAGQSPSQWLITAALPFFMKTDPLSTLNGLEKLRPKPGDAVTIEQTKSTFIPIPPKSIGPKGGIALKNGLHQGGDFTVLGYTVLDVADPVTMKLVAPFTPGGRLQIVVNGYPVEHLQTVAFKKGLYPMLLVLSMKEYHGVSWSSVEPRFEQVTEAAQVAEAKTYEAGKAGQQAEAATRRAAIAGNSSLVLHPASEIKPEDRKTMLWVADKEQAEAWLKYHQIVLN